MNSMIKQINSVKEFQELMNDMENKTVFVDFWATWCGPCRVMNPILENFSEDHTDDVIVAKVDVDAQGEIAAAYGIQSIPTIAIFKEDSPVPVKRIIGAVPTTLLESALTEVK